MKINLSKMGGDVVACLRKFPAEALVGLCFYGMYLIQMELTWKDEWYKQLNNLLALLPVFYVLTYSLNQLCRKRWRVVYYLSPLAFVPFLWADLHLFVWHIGYSFTLLLSLCVLLACKRKNNNRDFATNCVQTFVDLVVSFFTGGVLTLAVLVIYQSVLYIFDLNDTIHFWERTCPFISFIIIPLLFCHQQEKQSEHETLPRFMEIIINYILSPAVVVYTGILYLYIATIVVKWDLPKGGIGYMVLAFVAFSLAGRMAQLLVQKQPFAWFYNRFQWIALPPLALFWVGTVERITTYSLTESRVYLLASGLLTTLFIVSLFFSRLGRYQLMVLVSAACIALLTYIPGISAKSIGLRAQTQRMERYMQKLNLLDGNSLKFRKDSILISSVDSLQQRDYREVTACYAYLTENKGADYMRATYGSCPVIDNQYNRWDWDNLHSISLRTKEGLSIDGYTRYYDSGESDINKKDGVIVVTIQKQKVLRYDLNSWMNAHPDSMSRIQPERFCNDEPLMFRNDSCLLLIRRLDYYLVQGRYEYYDCEVGGVFMK